MKKYYFVTLSVKEGQTTQYNNLVIDMHPFQLMKKMSDVDIQYIITFYKELTEEEYKLSKNLEFIKG